MAIIEYISTESLSQAIERTLFAKFTYQPHRLPNMEVHESDFLLIANSNLSSQTLNTVCRSQFPESQADHYITYAINYFSQKGNLPFLWWISPKSKPYNLEIYLKKHGFTHEKSDVALALDLRDIKLEAPSSSPLVVQSITSSAHVVDLLDVIQNYYCENEVNVHSTYYKMVFKNGISTNGPYQYFIAYFQGKPVGFSSYFIDQGIAGLYDTLILPEFEDCGIALAMMKARFHHLLERGIHWAVLSSSSTSQQTYERLGFRACGRFSAYSWSPNKASQAFISNEKARTIQKA